MESGRFSIILKTLLVIGQWCFQFSLQFDDKKYLPISKFEHMRVPEMIKYWGYPGEEHKVTTEDGYILTNFRIANPGGYPVLFLHGLTATSDCFFLRDPSKDFVFLLWKKGYDVWLWNARGNAYSREHINMTIQDEAFSYYSAHELGIYDTTASIDYILNITGHTSVITVGHSLGASNTLIATSWRPEYQAKVRLNILWAQAAIMKHLVVKGWVDAEYSMFMRWFNVEDTQKIMHPESIYSGLKSFFCDHRTLRGKICQLSMGFVSGFGSNQTTRSAVTKIMTKFPSGSSMNVMKHMIQMIRTGELAPLSYGTKQNLKRYGTRYPKPYPIENIGVPTAIYYSCCNDYLSNPKDSKLLKSKLKNVVKFQAVPNKGFNHGDYLWAKDSYRLLYKDVLELIDQYNPGHFQLNQTSNENDENSL